MSARKTADDETDELHPRATTTLVGHSEAERTLLDAYRSGRIAHAWLIGGAQGIGKATLAYRMARFVLAHGNPQAGMVQAAHSLNIDANDPVARHVEAGTHGGLLVLERTLNDKGVMRTMISVENTRDTVAFFGSTSAAGGWRVCIVDTVDELNANAANALLKVLEEPPKQSLFLLVSNSPSRVLPTILSRCRKLMLRPLSIGDVRLAASRATGMSPEDPMLIEAAQAAEGSVSRALMLLGGDALKLHQRTFALLDTLPNIDPNQLHALGEAISGTDRAVLGAFIDSVERWVSDRVRRDGSRPDADLPRLARLAEVWEKISRSAREVESYNLERKPLVFSVFGLLAEATR